MGEFSVHAWAVLVSDIIPLLPFLSYWNAIIEWSIIGFHGVMDTLREKEILCMRYIIMLSGLILVVPMGAVVTPAGADTCLGYTVTRHISPRKCGTPEVPLDFTHQKRRQVIQAPDDCNAVIIIDACDVLCTGKGDDTIVVQDTGCACEGCIGKAEIDAGDGLNSIVCQADCDVIDGDGNSTVTVDGAHKVNFWGFGGDDVFFLQKLGGYDSRYYFVPGAGEDTTDMNKWVEGFGKGTDNFLISDSDVETIRK